MSTKLYDVYTLQIHLRTITCTREQRQGQDYELPVIQIGSKMNEAVVHVVTSL